MLIVSRSGMDISFEGKKTSTTGLQLSSILNGWVVSESNKPALSDVKILSLAWSVTTSGGYQIYA